MTVGLDDVLLGVLVASAHEALASQLRSDPAKKAMRRVVENAVRVTVADSVGHLDRRQVEHLRSVMQEHGTDLGRTKVGSLAELRVALQTWTAALDQPEYGERGYLTELGIDADSLCEQLTERIASGIHENGRAGGALQPLAEWLWRDDLKADVGNIRRDLSHLRAVGPPASPGGGLPGGTPDFTGRRHALDELAQRVEAHDPAGTVVAIHAMDGMAGIGKTELALRAAHQHKHRYPDGHYFINLHGYTEAIPPIPPETALEELLRQTGVPARAIPLDLAGRQARWQTLMARRMALVVLDNALDAAQVRPLLPGSAGCLVLITSRSRLVGLPGAQPLSLDVMPPTEAIELFARLAGAHRCPDPGAVARVVNLVGHLPVAVQAVAGQMREGLTVTNLADDLLVAKSQNSLVEETSSPGASVRAAFETSLQRLDQTQRQAFRMLGLHPGPTVGAPQFAAITGLPPANARAILRTLTDRNLITPARDRIGHRRYQLHDLLREFARQQAASHLPAEQWSAAIARLTIWYATAMSEVERLWDADSEPSGARVEGLRLTTSGEARTWLAAEQDNLLAFAEHVTSADAADIYHLSARLLYLFDHYATARTLHQAAADIYRQTGNLAGEADALTGLARIARFTGDYPRAGEHYRHALAIYRRTGNLDGAADTLNGLGEVGWFTGDYHAASEHFRLALALCKQTSNRAGEAEALTGIGEVARFTGDYHAAGEHYRAALAVCKQTRNLDGEPDALTGLGAVALLTGDVPAAGESFRRALAICQQTGNRVREADALRGLGQCALATGDYSAADEHFHHELAIYQQTGNRVREPDALWDLGQFALATGDYPAADEHLRHALAICRQTGNRVMEADVLWGRGQVARLTGDHAVADERYRRALAICQQTRNRAGEAAALSGLGHSAKAEGRRDEARERLQRALTVYAEIGSPLAETVRDALDDLGPG